MRIARTTYIEIKGLGNRIRTARKLDRRTLKEIAKEAGISEGHWHVIEKEQGVIPEETLLRVQEALQVNLGFQQEFDKLSKS
jgi:transcriptional regulator with XRE-family HTH domain